MIGHVAAPELNPYLYPERARDRLREALERHVDFARIPALLGPASPLLLVSAVEVRTGEFRVFRDADVTVEAVLASAAVPTIFRAVHLAGGVYWDGLFSQNPPVRELARAKPDEIWVIQINPTARAEEPRALAAIRDRRNELAGNISLEQELFFIETINRLVADGRLSGDGYRHIDVRRIELERELDYESKLDRRPEFIAELVADGEREAERFLAERPGAS